MSLYAVENIGDAYEATRAFLFPFSLRRWLKLALVVFFVGGASLGSGFQGGFEFDTPVNQPIGPDVGPAAGPGGGVADGAAIGQFLPLIIGLAALALLIVLAFAVVGSVM